MKVGKALTSVSAFARPDSHLIEHTVQGGLLTVITVLTSLTLFLSELHNFVYDEPVYEMGVTTERNPLLDVHLDISFPSMPCAILNVDMIDSSGEVESDAWGIDHIQLHKVRLDGRTAKPLKSKKKGEYHQAPPDMIVLVGGMLVSESQQHLKDIEQELDDHEGCHLHGLLRVKRLQGVFRITVHMQEFMMLKSTQKRVEKAVQEAMARSKKGQQGSMLEIGPDFTSINVSHHIHHLRFGPDYPGRHNPLDGFERIVDHDYGSYRYFLQVVPATYIQTAWIRTKTYLYSVSEYFLPGHTLQKGESTKPGDVNVSTMPAVEFRFDMSPIAVSIMRPQRSLLHFLVRCCAVVGGCVALMKFLDKVVTNMLRTLGL